VFDAGRRYAGMLEQRYMDGKIYNSSTYGHSQLKTGHPVRSAIHKQLNGRLVLRWVTTWESLLLYVLHFLLSYHQSYLFLPVRTLLLLGVRYTILVINAVLTQKHIRLFLIQGHTEHFSNIIPIYRRIPSTVSPCR
jgi:hypothetical protein